MSGIRLNISVFLIALLIAPSMALAATKQNPAKSARIAKPAKVKPSARKKIDYVAIGMVAFQKKNFAEALRNFELATKADAKNHLSWLGHARSVIALNIETEPVDYCNYSSNWILLSLASLSSALDLGRNKAVAKLATFTESSFKKFRERIEFKNWFVLTQLPLKTDEATQKFFAKHNDWLIPKQPMPSSVVTFAPDHALTIVSADGGRGVGKWTAGADRVVVTTTGGPRIMNLSSANYAYDAGKIIKRVVLKDQTGGEEWLMGPEIADCPK